MFQKPLFKGKRIKNRKFSFFSLANLEPIVCLDFIKEKGLQMWVSYYYNKTLTWTLFLLFIYLTFFSPLL